jgi:hypothetical protein
LDLASHSAGPSERERRRRDGHGPRRLGQGEAELGFCQREIKRRGREANGPWPGPEVCAAIRGREREKQAKPASIVGQKSEREIERKKKSLFIFTNLLQIQTNLNSKPHKLTPQPNKDIYALA